MSRHRVVSFTGALLGCALISAPISAQADSLPTVTITSATGYASYGYIGPEGGAVGASLSAPNFSLGFFDVFPSIYTIGGVGESLSTEFYLAAVVGAPAVPNGTVTVGGKSYPVDYKSGDARVNGSISSVTVASGYETIEMPGEFLGAGLACTMVYPLPSGCTPPPAVPQPTKIANVDIDIPGFVTLTFSPSPTGPFQHNEYFSERFTPIPEPATALLLLGALPIVLAIRKQRRTSPTR
jgi:hypothetical protein